MYFEIAVAGFQVNFEKVSLHHSPLLSSQNHYITYRVVYPQPDGMIVHGKEEKKCW